MTRLICDPCAAGTHPHDRYTGARAGEDAGCPRAIDGHECRCAFRYPPAAPSDTLGAWIEQNLDLTLSPWQREFLAKWVRR